MLVMTPMDGSAVRERRLISPKWDMPISMTAAVCCSSSCISVFGSPISLFRLPCVFSVQNWDSSTQAIISFVVVFPTLPVTPTRTGWNFSR